VRLLESLVPERLAVEELRAYPSIPELFPEEKAVVAHAVQKRQDEFAAVRHCARRALARLGYPRVPILPGECGAPVWPDGIVGSMTHCVGYSAAAVGSASDVLAVGIDAEPHGPLPEGVLDTVGLASEEEQVHQLLGERPEGHWDRLLFSAKESVYKAWFPLTGAWLDFDQVHVRIDPAGGSFDAELLVPGPVVNGSPLGSFEGRWGIAGGILVTAVVVLVRQ
jgi:4'-phosphopantetheinyl transferase EntD